MESKGNFPSCMHPLDPGITYCKKTVAALERNRTESFFVQCSDCPLL